MASEGEEDLVEGRLAERKRRDPDVRPGQFADSLGGPVGVGARGRERRRVRLEVDVGRERAGEDACCVGPAASARTMSQTWLRERGSSPVLGSSRNISSGVTMMLAAMSNRRRIPPEYSTSALRTAGTADAS